MRIFNGFIVNNPKTHYVDAISLTSFFFLLTKFNRVRIGKNQLFVHALGDNSCSDYL